MQWQSEAWQLWLLRADGSCTDWSNLRHTGRIYDCRRYSLFSLASSTLSTTDRCLITPQSVTGVHGVQVHEGQGGDSGEVLGCMGEVVRVVDTGVDDACMLSPPEQRGF